MAKTTGIASIAEGRSDLHRIDPRKLVIKAGWNSRDMSDPSNIEHVEQLALSIAEVGVKEPLTVYWEDHKAYVTNGHCRLLATMKAIERGADVKTVPVKIEDRYSNEADRIFSQILLNSGKPFSQIEQAKVFKKLLDLGWQQNDIAKKAGISGGRVSQILELLTLPEGVKTMVVAGQVSPTMAIQTVKATGSGSKAEQALKAGLENAKAEGKTKVKPTHMEGETKLNIKKAVIDAFEYADVDDSDDSIVVVKFPMEQWEVIRKLLGL